MSPRHHLDPTTLISYAAGALPPEMAAIAALHFAACGHCRNLLRDAEQIGGALVEKQLPVWPEADARTRREAMLQALDATVAAPVAPVQAPPPVDPDALPKVLQPFFGKTFSALKWRWMGPGAHYVRAIGPTGVTLLLLRIGPGKRMPVHGHQGAELTQILQGAYDDALGHFQAGDAADLDAETEHQPITSPGTACICVSALDQPLRFPGWLARKLQPVFGI